MGERFSEAECKPGPQPHCPCSESSGPGLVSPRPAGGSPRLEHPVQAADGAGGRRGEGRVLATRRAPGPEKASEEPKDN